MPYLLLFNLILASLTVAYRLFFRKGKSFTFRRFVLLGILLGALLLPVLPLPEMLPLESATFTGLPEKLLPTASEAAPAPSSQTEVQPLPASGMPISSTERQAAIRPIDLRQILIAGYWVGGGLLSVRFLFQLFSLIRLLHQSSRRSCGRYTLVEPVRSTPPFSFFRYIVMDESAYSPALRAQILRHEQVHAERCHSLDILAAELLLIFCWFNPLAWLYRRLVSANLEYEVDDVLLREGIDRKRYQYNLLRVMTVNGSHPLATSYNQSQLKTRILMMNRKESPGFQFFRLLPFLIALLFTAVLAGCVKERIQQGAAEDLYVIITHDASTAELNSLRSQLESFDVQLKVSKLDRYNDGSISELTLRLSAGGSPAGNIYDKKTPYGIYPLFIHKTGKALSSSTLLPIHLKKIAAEMDHSTLLVAGGEPSQEFLNNLGYTDLNPWEEGREAEFLQKIRANGGRGEPIEYGGVWMLENYPGDWMEDLKLWVADLDVPPANKRLLINGQVSSLTLDQINRDQFSYARPKYRADPVYDTESGAWLDDENQSLTVELATKEYAVASKMVYLWEPNK